MARGQQQSYNVSPEIPTSGWSYDRHGFLEGFSETQWDALRSAVSSAAQCVEGGCTAGEIDSKTIANLEGTGLFTNSDLDAIDYGLLKSDPHGPSFYEQGGNPQPFITNWYLHAQKSVEDWLSQAKPKQGGGGGGSGKKKGGGGSGGSNSGGDQQLLNKYLPEILRGDYSDSSQSSGVPYQAPQGLGGGSSLPMLVLVGGAGLVAWLVLRKKKKP